MSKSLLVARRVLLGIGLLVAAVLGGATLAHFAPCGRPTGGACPGSLLREIQDWIVEHQFLVLAFSLVYGAAVVVSYRHEVSAEARAQLTHRSAERMLSYLVLGVVLIVLVALFPGIGRLPWWPN